MNLAEVWNGLPWLLRAVVAIVVAGCSAWLGEQLGRWIFGPIGRFRKE